MVSWQDFAASSPTVQLLHLAIGVVWLLAAILLFRLNPVYGALAIVGFAVFVGIKEFGFDTWTGCFASICGEGQSINDGIVDATFYGIGGAGGIVAGLLL